MAQRAKGLHVAEVGPQVPAVGDRQDMVAVQVALAGYLSSRVYGNARRAVVQRKSVFLSLVAILVLVGLGYLAWHYVRERSAQSCKACMRLVHSHMKTGATMEIERAS